VLTPLLRKYQLNPEHILVTSSVAGKIPVPLSAVYAGCKHFLHGYFRSLMAEESSSSALTVDLICPGPVDTNFHKKRHQENESSTAPTSKKKMKMTAERCAQLLLSSQQQQQRRRGGISEVWISNQPALTMLYLQRYFPCLVQWMINKVGTKRVDLWRRGLDLYDPESWTKQ
jgi:dehydrogenase/reductase SDR family protein 7